MAIREVLPALERMRQIQGPLAARMPDHCRGTIRSVARRRPLAPLALRRAWPSGANPHEPGDSPRLSSFEGRSNLPSNEWVSLGQRRLQEPYQRRSVGPGVDRAPIGSRIAFI